MVRSEATSKDGFKLWHALNQEFMPSTRQRSLALAQALGSFPCFSKDRSALEPILNYEQLVFEYEQASGSTYPKELMAATLIKCCQPRLREQIQLSITLPIQQPMQISERRLLLMKRFQKLGQVIKC